MELLCSLKSFSWPDTTMNIFVFCFFFEWTDHLSYNQAISSFAQPVKNMISPALWCNQCCFEGTGFPHLMANHSLSLWCGCGSLSAVSLLNQVKWDSRAGGRYSIIITSACQQINVLLKVSTIKLIAVCNCRMCPHIAVHIDVGAYSRWMHAGGRHWERRGTH